jgi:hypothetical protein
MRSCDANPNWTLRRLQDYELAGQCRLTIKAPMQAPGMQEPCAVGGQGFQRRRGRPAGSIHSHRYASLATPAPYRRVSEPNSRFHRPSPIIAPGVAPGLSSSSENALPAIGLTPSTRVSAGLRRFPEICSGSPLPVRVKLAYPTAPRCWKELDCFQS